jgi:CRP-like cAMP-binding protein
MVNLEKINLLYKIGKGLRLQDIQHLFNLATQKKFEPNEFLIQAGSQRREIFFIKKGLIRSFIINEKGEEITMGLFWENRFVASPEIILNNEPSKYYFQALEETETLLMDYDLAQKIIEDNPKLERSRKFFLQKMLKDASERIESFVLYSPEERYIKYVESKPDIVNRVPNKYLANVLGMTPVSLSRIRKRIASKKNH